MAPANEWDRIERIFLAVVDLPPAERAVVLHQMCGADTALRGEVESLLAADTAGEATLGHSVTSALKTEAGLLLEGSRIEGTRFGAYRLIREIGRGGMGSVYLAARADEQYESDVAIKIVRPGLDTDFILRRFRRERQILARLKHPNIARLFDGGTTENQVPYLVMEYIAGAPITRYADDHRLDVDQRLRLFLPVCYAVEHAHRAFIVHRDLKPGNILVDSTGAPKLLDFGISKLLHNEPRDPSETQDVAMATPDYASPEQITGDPVTAASDIYSLGAVLYELLTGILPHAIDQSTPLAWERAICHEPTVPPSLAVRHDPTLSRRLAGDLDTIILTAMQKEPERRYASVAHLSEDLRRHLDYLPVLAQPDTTRYRASKFFRRHRVSASLAGAAAAAVVALAGFAAYEAQQVHTARHALQQERAVYDNRRAVLEQARVSLLDAIRQNPDKPQLQQQLNAANAALAALSQGTPQQ